jgi:hypothetical protein
LKQILQQNNVHYKSIGICARYVTCTVKLVEENPTFAGLAQGIGFGSASLRTLPWLVNGAAEL